MSEYYNNIKYYENTVQFIILCYNPVIWGLILFTGDRMLKV